MDEIITTHSEGHAYRSVSIVMYIAICFISFGIAVPVLEALPNVCRFERILLCQSLYIEICTDCNIFDFVRL